MTEDLAPILRFAETVQRSSLHRLWKGQSLKVDSGHLLAAMVGAGKAVPFGLGVTLMPLRHPYEAALQARSLSLLSNRSFVMGLGTATPDFTAGLRGAPYDKPLAAAEEYLSIVKSLLDGNTLAYRGHYYQTHGRMLEASKPEVEIGMGVLRSGAARVAGRCADVAVTVLTPVGYMRKVILPSVLQASESRDKAVRIATIAHVVLDNQKRDLREIARLAAQAHTSQPHYARMLRESGIEVEDRDVAKTMDRMVDKGAILAGSAAELATSINELWNSGVDEVILNPSGVMHAEGLDAALADIDSIVSACGF